MEGKLKSWSTDRGFGFIAPSQGGKDVFVHISALPKDGSRPIVGEVLAFDITTDRDGRYRAINVRRPGQQVTAASPRRQRGRQQAGESRFGRALSLMVVIGLGVYGYDRYQSFSEPVGVSERSESLLGQRSSEQPAARFVCDGRTQCSQMTSCDEAVFFLRNCPGTQMDGNGDGEPCEQQWCR